MIIREVAFWLAVLIVVGVSCAGWSWLARRLRSAEEPNIRPLVGQVGFFFSLLLALGFGATAVARFGHDEWAPAWRLALGSIFVVLLLPRFWRIWRDVDSSSPSQ